MRRPAAAAALAAALSLLPRGPVAAGMTATVRGEVVSPGTYDFEAGDRLSSLVEKAGGLTDAAFPRGAALVRKTVADAQRRELRDITGRIAAETRGGGPRERDERDRFLAALEGLAPEGRVPVRLAHPRLMKGTADDILLDDGDVLTVPKDPGTVVVAGAVKSAGALPAREDSGYRDYVRAAGGAAPDADLKKAWILSADGTAVPLARPLVAWNPADARWEFTAFASDPVPVRSGDTVVIPRKAAWIAGAPDVDALLVRISVVAGKAVVP